MTRRLLLACFVLTASLSAQTQTPMQMYTAYRAVFEHATDFEGLRSFLSADARAKITALPAADRPAAFTLLKHTAAAWQITLVTDTELSTGGHVLLLMGVDGADRPLRGVVELTREGDAWKIVRETWQHATP